VGRDGPGQPSPDPIPDLVFTSVNHGFTCPNDPAGRILASQNNDGSTGCKNPSIVHPMTILNTFTVFLRWSFNCPKDGLLMVKEIKTKQNLTTWWDIYNIPILYKKKPTLLYTTSDYNRLSLHWTVIKKPVLTLTKQRKTQSIMENTWIHPYNI